MVLAGVIRVFLPLVDASHYPLWIVLSGCAWVISFSLFLVCFGPVLVRPRADAKPD
jgi:uncharacterized protein involved in response to NO